MVAWTVSAHTICFYLAVFVLKTSQTEARSYLETNEVVDKVDERSLNLLPCTPHSICGYLQANSRGINYQRRCGCPSGTTCPMLWDSADGHSVLQGSDQYKFCGPAPNLSACQDSFTAYTSRILFSKETDEILSKSDHIHCICPDTHNYVLANKRFEDPDEETEAMEITYVCAKLNPCEMGETCKTLSQTSSEFLVNRKCECPHNQRCPTDTMTGIKSLPLGNGFAHYIRCQH